MPIKPVPRDANGWNLLDRASEIFTDRISLTTAEKTIYFGRDIKGCAFYVESGTVIDRGVKSASVSFLDNAAVVDNEDGTVTLAATGHGFTAGDFVEIYDTDNYDTGTNDREELQTAIELESVATDTITITATYVEETIAVGAYLVGYRDAQHAAASSWTIPIAINRMTPVCTLSASETAVVSVIMWR